MLCITSTIKTFKKWLETAIFGGFCFFKNFTNHTKVVISKK